MTEIELLEQKLLGLARANERFLDMFEAGQITETQHLAYMREILGQQKELSRRLQILRDTGGTATQVINDETAKRLRDAVRALAEANLTEAAVRNLIDQALAVHDALTETGPASVDDMPAPFSASVDAAVAARLMRKAAPAERAQVSPDRALEAAAVALLAASAALLARAAR